MLVYHKIAWYLDNDINISVLSLGKEKCRLIKKGFIEMQNIGYSYGVVLLTDALLSEFYGIYQGYILKKPNPCPVDLPEVFNGRLTSKTIYFGYIRDSDNTLLAGGIFVHKPSKKRDTFMLSYRAKSSDFKFQGLDFGYYLEYLFYQQGSLLSVEQYSRGRDDNGFGFMSSAIGVGVHKVQLHFLPYISSGAKQLLIDETTIVVPSLFFVDPDDNQKFTGVRLYLQPSELESPANMHIINLFHKRGYTVHISAIS